MKTYLVFTIVNVSIFVLYVVVAMWYVIRRMIGRLSLRG